MIVIADDYADGAQALCRLLTAHGYRCVGANGGQETLALIRACPPGEPLLVVLDEMMPDIGGIDVLRALRADQSTIHVPVIMYSAGLNVPKREEAMTLGALDWILKGIDVQMTIRAVVDHYERVGGAKQLDQPKDSAGPTNGT